MIDEHANYDEQPSLSVTNSNAPYHVRTSPGEEEIESVVSIDDLECMTEVGSIYSQVDCLSNT
jgi:hypothetical protein